MKNLAKAIAVVMVCALASAGMATGASAKTPKPSKAQSCAVKVASKAPKSVKPAAKVKGRKALAKQALKPAKVAKAAKTCKVA